jgi:hypothetical protein|nr:MAG TPA: hypothetical protein [Caudoviricetes sp.]
MTQLILDTTGTPVTMPESQKDGYRAELQPLSVDVEMVSGRIVRELRGNVWVISYQYGYFSDEMKQSVLSVCEKGRGQAITCVFLPPHSEQMITSDFLVTKLTYPKFMWSRQIMGEVAGDKGETIETLVPVPVWGDFGVELREVKPSA